MYLSALWNDVADVSQIAGLLLALVLAGMAWRQLRLATAALDKAEEELAATAVAAESQAVLALDEAFAQFQDLRDELRKAERSQTTYEPEDVAARARLSRYLVVFERLGLLVRRGLIDPQLAKQLYGYALSRILLFSDAPTILRQEAAVHNRGPLREKPWEHFIFLWDNLLDEPVVPLDLRQTAALD
jgi:hypothetical protein